MSFSQKFPNNQNNNPPWFSWWYIDWFIPQWNLVVWDNKKLYDSWKKASNIEMKDQKWEPLWHAELDAWWKVPASQLPSYVDDVITNNRGVETYEVYQQEPMYVIDFTGANKLAIPRIRNYNRENNYDDFNMNCVGTHDGRNTGDKCLSVFLRSDMMSSVMNGGCAIRATNQNNFDTVCN